MRKKTKRTQEAASRRLQRMVGCSTPELSDASTGWWWLWCDEQWCAAYAKNDTSKWTGKKSLDVVVLRPTGGMSRDRLEIEEIQAEKWGGRIAAPNVGAQRPVKGNREQP